MKQFDIDNELRAIARAEAKARGWKSVSGIPYWTIGPLFFVLTQSARAKEGAFHGSLRFKWLALDKVLWRVLDLSSNEDEPFSLHANGAFVLAGQEVLSVSKRDIEWAPGALKRQVQDTMQRSHERAAEIASQAGTLDAYLACIQREHTEFLARHPGAPANIWRETLLAALLVGDTAEAARIARSRISEDDSGGYSSGGQSFYELALALCEAPPVPAGRVV